MGQMKTYRIRFAMVLGLISALWAPASVIGTQLVKARIGIFTPGLGLVAVHEALQEGLARLGYTEGKNITFLMVDTKGSTADLPARAATLIAAKPDLVFAVTNPHALAAKQATTKVPVIFAWVGDPVSAGLVANYPYFKSNLTGVTAIGDILSGKRLEVLLDIAPKARRLLVLVATKEFVSVSSLQSLEAAAQKFGVHLVRRDVTSEQEIKKALEETKGSVDAIFHVPSNLVRSSIDLLITNALAERVPLSVNEDRLVDRGALISYGPSSRLVGIQAAELVDKVLKGAKPGEIMVETPDRYLLAINQATAKQIGVNIPRRILERADRLIQ